MTTPRHPPDHRRLRITAASALALAAVLTLLGNGAQAASGTAPSAPAAPRPGTAVPVPVPAAAGAADADAVQRLRERLAERLASVHTNAAGNAVDLRVVSAPPAEAGAAAAVLPRAGASVAPTGRRPVRSAASSAAVPASSGAAHGSTRGSMHWSYSGQVGPQAWGGLRPEFGLCAKGERQSPIDIREGIAVDLEPIQFRYQPSGFSVIDNGHTVQVNLAPGNTIEVGGRRFELFQFHFHRPSEERIDGRQFELSVHLVHKDSEGRLAVVGVLLGKGAAQPVVQTVWNNLPLERHQDVKARATLDPSELLPQDRRYYTYMGSMTTPPCSEGVQWLVLRQPVSAAPEQIDIFSRMYPMNARPVQNAAGRRILQSN
jgi:carbonic anhydrase